MKVKVKLLSRIRLFATPWIVAYQASLYMGFSRQGYWSGLPFPSPGDLPDPGMEPGSPDIAGRWFTLWASREAQYMGIYIYARTKTKTKIYSVTLTKTKGKLMGSMGSANNWNTSSNKAQQPQGKHNITSYVIYNDQHRIKNYETKQEKCDPWSKWKTVNRNLSMLENLSFVESINLQS